MKFLELEINDRFSSIPNNGRIWQKISTRYAIDLSEGKNGRGEYVQDSFRSDAIVYRRHDRPVVEYDPEKLITDPD